MTIKAIAPNQIIFLSMPPSPCENGTQFDVPQWRNIALELGQIFWPLSPHFLLGKKITPAAGEVNRRRLCRRCYFFSVARSKTEPVPESRTWLDSAGRASREYQ